jgi:hypothetical protein
MLPLHRLLAGVVLAVSLIAAAPARGDDASAGWRVFAAAGYPTAIAFGTGYRSAGGTELLVSAGALEYEEIGAMGSVDVSGRQEVIELPRGAIHLGLSGAALHTWIDAGPDCEGCGAERRTYLFAGPRIGARLRLGPHPVPGAPRFMRGPHFADVSGGPMLGRCHGDCPGRTLVSLAVVARLIFTF